MKTILATFGAALLLSACTTSVTDAADGAEESRAIGFRTPAVARGVIDNSDSDDFTAFDVWGWQTASDGTSTNLFPRVEVTRNGGAWNYEGTRYWQDGHMYNFYALFPSNLPNASYAADGTLTITDYDARQNHDLMAAARTGMDGSNPQAVAFTFQHLLARVTVAIRTGQGVTAKVTNSSLYGIHTQGSLDGDTWTVGGTTGTADNPDYTAKGELSIGEGTQSNLFANLLLIPQNTDGLRLNLSLERTIGNNQTETLQKTFDLGHSVQRLEDGQHYRFMITVEVDAITFSNFTVDEWGETHTGGDINIGSTTKERQEQ